MSRLNYLELPAAQLPETRDFYAGAFSWQFSDYGPDYAATAGQGTNVGINASTDHAIDGILPLIESDDLEAALERVTACGGTIAVPIFAFPGGRRFHFRDPAGNLLGVYQNDPG